MNPPYEDLIHEMCHSLMDKLLSSRYLERLWVNRVAEAIEGEKEGRRDGRHIEGKESCHGRKSPLTLAVIELASTVEDAVRTFESSVDLSSCQSEEASCSNRDSALLFDCRRILSRLEKRKDSEEQIEVATRRLTRLARTMGMRLTVPYSIASCIVLATGVCDMGFELEEMLSRLGSSSMEVQRLRSTLESLNENVVARLKELTSTPCPTVSRSASLPVSTSRRRLPQRSPSTVTQTTPLRPPRSKAVKGMKSPGYLLPYELRETRSKLPRRPSSASKDIRNNRERERRRSGTMKGHALGPIGRKEMIELHRKWDGLLDAEGLFNRAMIEDKEGKAAMRLAREITREVLQQLDSIEKEKGQ